MAINPGALFPGQSTLPNASYPYGSARDVSSPGAGDGTPVRQVWVNDLWGFQQRILSEAGFTPSGNPDTVLASQYWDALAFLFAKKASPAFTGVPTAPTAAPGTNSTQIATTAFVQTKVGTLGTAATRDVGTGANQIPDINSFTHLTDLGSRHLYSVPMTDGIFRIYVFQVNLPVGTTNLTLPVPFPTTVTSANITQVSQVSIPTGNLAVQINSANVIQMVNWSNTAVTAQVIMTGR